MIFGSLLDPGGKGMNFVELGTANGVSGPVIVLLFNTNVTVCGSIGPDVESELLKLAKHKRSWILQSIKRFGDYYSNRYGNKEVKFLIARIIERYELNKDLDQKDRIYLVSPQFVEDKINNVMNIPGDIGYTCRLGLFSGLRLVWRL
jgi:hypothetical protein